MKTLVIILIGLMLMGCEGEEGLEKSLIGSQFETVLMGDYSGDVSEFSNCAYDECFSSGNDLVFYKINSDGFDLKIEVFFNSMDGNPAYTESRDNIFEEQIIGDEITDISFFFGSNRDIELEINGQNGRIIFPGSNSDMPSLLSF